MSTLLSIIKDNWEWRKQIASLSVFALKKRARGAVLGWAWLFVKPTIYILVFWFALEIGLRAGRGLDGDYPFFLWLVAGLVPWFFMSDMIGGGADAYHKYPYLVNKVKFPLSCISTIYTLSSLLINLVMFVILMVIYFLYGQPFDIYLIQVPILLLLLFLFWDIYSIFASQLSGVSKDFSQLMKSIVQPLFWLSGIIFNMSALTANGFGWAETVMYFNPVSFFATAFRDALCYKTWFWENPAFFWSFVGVFAFTLICAIISYKRLHEEVADVL